MSFQVKPCDGACGAQILGLNLSQKLSSDLVAELRAAWLEHHILVFPDQNLSKSDLEKFTLYFGEFGEDPYLGSLEDHKNIVALSRKAHETGPIFADSWHTDWSFLPTPPAGTCLYGEVIPPHGGDTFFINQHKVLQEMPDALRQKLEGKMAIHSAAAGYAPDGLYGVDEKTSDRSINIIISDEANKTQLHPLIRNHPETGEAMIFGCFGYVRALADVDLEESNTLLGELYAWQTQEAFQYRHQWSPGMLVMWDNRSVLHKASGGYEGFDRLLYRTTIADA